MSRELKLEFDDDNGLLCPGCGHNNLHHSLITVFTRSHEDAEATVMAVAVPACVPDDKRVPSELMGMNPSSRRDGLAILFWCEVCDFIGELTIAQHKGSTYLAWRE